MAIWKRFCCWLRARYDAWELAAVYDGDKEAQDKDRWRGGRNA